MPEDIIDRVARAIVAHAMSEHMLDDTCEIAQEMRRAQARAAILALREPTDAMINAAHVHGMSNLHEEWRAMIDAAVA